MKSYQNGPAKTRQFRLLRAQPPATARVLVRDLKPPNPVVVVFSPPRANWHRRSPTCFRRRGRRRGGKQTRETRRNAQGGGVEDQEGRMGKALGTAYMIIMMMPRGETCCAKLMRLSEKDKQHMEDKHGTPLNHTSWKLTYNSQLSSRTWACMTRYLELKVHGTTRGLEPQGGVKSNQKPGPSESHSNS